jgi:hypothetical protein
VCVCVCVCVCVWCVVCGVWCVVCGVCVCGVMHVTNMRRVRKVKIHHCRPIGKLFMFIVATLPSTLILYLEPCSFDSGRTGFV